jgi:hypothetical protein
MQILRALLIIIILSGCGREQEVEISRYQIERVPKLNSIGSGLQYYTVETTSRFVNHFYSVSDGSNEPAILEIKTTKDLAQVVKYIPIKVDAKLDLEGIALAEDGSFWLANEEGPSIINFDPKLKKIKNILIAGQQLPIILRSMHSGRGFEGIAVYGDKIFAAMQSSLNIAGRTPEALFLRIISYNFRNDTVKTYAYPLDDFSNKRRSQVQITDIAALDEERLLVVEMSPSGAQKLILVDLKYATNINGKLAGDEELEFVADRNILFGKHLSKNSGLIVPLNKHTVLDFVDIGWNGGVIEGLTLLPESQKIAISSAGSEAAVMWIFAMPHVLAPKTHFWFYLILLAAVIFAYIKYKE